MTRTRVGDPFLSVDDYGRSLPRFSVNLLVRNVETSLKFYRDVLGAIVRYADNDFAALSSRHRFHAACRSLLRPPSALPSSDGGARARCRRGIALSGR